MKKCLISIMALILLNGCAQIGAAASKVNWYKVGANLCFRLSDKLNDKAEEKEKELKEQEKEDVEHQD